MTIIGYCMEREIWKKVNIDEMQFGFMPGKGTT